MNPLKQTTVILFIFSLNVISFAQAVQSRSLYAITNHGDSTISAYKILGDEIQKQLETNIDWGKGVVGLALDPDSAMLFFSYDNSQKLELINAKTMTEIKNIRPPFELAGIAFDKSKQKFYDIIPSSTIPGPGDALIITIDENDIKEALDWLDKLRLDEEIKEAMTEEEFQEFREALEEDLMRLLKMSEWP